MELTPREADLLGPYLSPFLAKTVRGIIGSESPVCSRIAAFPSRAGR